MGGYGRAAYLAMWVGTLPGDRSPALAKDLSYKGITVGYALGCTSTASPGAAPAICSCPGRAP
jgi:hypothetical protein